MSRSDATAFERWKEAGGFVDQHLLDSPALVDPSDDGPTIVAYAAGVPGTPVIAVPMTGVIEPGIVYWLAGSSFHHGRLGTPADPEAARVAATKERFAKQISHYFAVTKTVSRFEPCTSGAFVPCTSGSFQLDCSVHKTEPARFGGPWLSAFTAALAAAPSPRLRVATSLLWERLWQLGPLREPHIESPPGELRFTWNRGGHYLEVSAHDDGHLEWFYRDPEGQTQGGDEGEELPEAFVALLRHARP